MQIHTISMGNERFSSLPTKGKQNVGSFSEKLIRIFRELTAGCRCQFFACWTNSDRCSKLLSTMYYIDRLFQAVLYSVEMKIILN